MRLLSLNLGLFEANNNLVKDLISKTEPDLIAFQEVTRSVNSQSNQDYVSLPTVITKESRLKYSYYSPNWVIDKFEQANFHGQEMFAFDPGGLIDVGNLVGSQFEIIKGQTIFVKGSYSYFTDWSLWPEEDARSFQIVDLVIGSHKLRLINYHGLWTRDKLDTRDTVKASDLIIKSATETDCPVVICGDFNLFPDTKSIQMIKKHFVSLVDIYKIQTTRPHSNELNHLRNVVDYIFVSNKVHVKKFEVIDTEVSDHLPLVLEFEL